MVCAPILVDADDHSRGCEGDILPVAVQVEFLCVEEVLDVVFVAAKTDPVLLVCWRLTTLVGLRDVYVLVKEMLDSLRFIDAVKLGPKFKLSWCCFGVEGAACWYMLNDDLVRVDLVAESDAQLCLRSGAPALSGFLPGCESSDWRVEVDFWHVERRKSCRPLQLS